MANQTSQASQLRITPPAKRKFSADWITEAEDLHGKALAAAEAGNLTEAQVLAALAISAASIASANEDRWAGYRSRTAN